MWVNLSKKERNFWMKNSLKKMEKMKKMKNSLKKKMKKVSVRAKK